MSTVLFVTSNGTGLGHLTRCMAIARRLPAGMTPIIFTLSKAISVVRDQGFYVEYFPSPNASQDGISDWNEALATRLVSLIEEYSPEVVAFDGAHPYKGLRHVIERHAVPATVWIRRAMWQQGKGAQAIASTRSFGAVIEPGEFAADADEGLTVNQRDQVVTVDPVLYCDDGDVLSREEAERELGLLPGRPRMLLQLGTGSGQRASLLEAIPDTLPNGEEFEIALLESAIDDSTVLPNGVVKIAATYPVARYYRAFDFVVSAAGYNAYHELIRFGVPAAFVPVSKPTDDQAARARYAEEAGVGKLLQPDDTATVKEALEPLLDPDSRAEMAERATRVRFPNGAARAAGLMAQLATTGALLEPLGTGPF